MEPRRSYSLKSTVLLIGDEDISAGGEDGAVEYEVGADKLIPKVLVNGLASVSMSNNDSVIATITVGSHTLAARILDELAEAQWAGLETDPIITPLEFYHRDPSNGDVTQDRFAAFLEKPPMNRGQETQDVQYRVFLPTAHATGKSPRGTLTSTT